MPTTRATRWALATRLGQLLLPLALLNAPAVAAAEQAQDPRARALELFELSERHYQAGDLEQARALLLEAYQLDPNPILQYNLGRVCEALGKPQEAATAYRTFLEGSPEAPDRGAIERRIETLEKQIAERAAAQRRTAEVAPKPTKPAPPPPPPPQESPTIAPWIITGAGAVLLAGGVVSGLLARQAHNDAVDDPTFEGAKDSQDRAEMLATLANVGFTVGGASVAVGLGWALLDSSGSTPEQPASSTSCPWPASITLGGRF